MIENLNYLYQKQSVAETPNFAGKHKRALSKQSKSSNSKNKATKSLNRDLNLGIPEKENARTRP